MTDATTRTVQGAVVCLINTMRQANGLRRLTVNARLQGVAARHAADMVNADYYGHTMSTGQTLLDVVKATGYVPAGAGLDLGEDISAGADTARTVVDAWMASRGHRANILGASFRDVGVGAIARTPAVAVASGAAAGTFSAVFGDTYGGA